MSRFSGKQGKGAARAAKETRHEEAVERNGKTQIKRTRAHREGRFPAEKALLAEVFTGEPSG